MVNKELPEERLLDVIRGSGSIYVENKSFSLMLSRCGVIWQQLRRVFNSRSFAYLFSVLFVVFSVFLLKEILLPFQFDYNASGASGMVNTAGNIIDDTELDISRYLTEISKKDIFNQGRVLVTQSGSDTSVEDLMLLGIITVNPVQAIIKNKKTNATSFLGIGDTFGEITIINIQQGAVTVESRGKEVELRL